MKKWIATLLCFALLFSVMPIHFAASSASVPTTLRFSKDGKFKIMVFADCQDDSTADTKMTHVMGEMLEATKPDLVVFTGDNVVTRSTSAFKTGADAMLNPVVSRGIPYAITFGNHDDQYGVSKQTQLDYYRTVGNCLTYDAVPSLTGVGNCNLPIYASNSNAMAFNLWMIDSNTYEGSGTSKYDHVHQDQLDWLKSTQDSITAQQGHVVPSMMFQHIIVPEVRNCFATTSPYTFKPGMGSGMVQESPCPPATNGGQYSAVCNLGGVLGIVTGHDHINNFIAKPGPVDLISVSGITYASYGEENVRGCHLITLDESNLTTYKIEDYLCTRCIAGDYEDKTPVPAFEQSYYKFTSGVSYVSEIRFSASSAKQTALDTLTNQGFTPVSVDLNKGAGGDFIYLGYKLTTDPKQAVRDIRFLIGGSGTTASPSIRYGGVDYMLAGNVDLNKGSGGQYIYGYYTRDSKVGAPVTAVSIVESYSFTDAVQPCGTFYNRTANLNVGTKGVALFCKQISTSLKLSAEGFLSAYDKAVSMQEVSCTLPSMMQQLNAAVSDATSTYQELVTLGGTYSTQAQINAYATRLTQAVLAVEENGVHTVPQGSFCDTERTCTVCGAKVPAGEHSMTESVIAPTCTKKGYTLHECTKCPYAYSSDETDVAAHNYVEKERTPATCVAEGSVKYVCSVCGDIRTEVLPFSNHRYEKTVTLPTCTQDGYTLNVCSVCDNVVYDEIVAALGHDFDDTIEENVSIVLPGVVHQGSKTVKCSRCDETTTEVLPATGKVGGVLKVDNTKAVPGHIMEVTISIQNNSGLVDLGLNVEYDKNVLTLISVEDSGLMGEGIAAWDESLEGNPFTILWLNADATENITAGGVLVTLRFRVQSNAASQESLLQIMQDPSVTRDIDGKELIFFTAVKNIVLEPNIAGDADCNGKLDLRDVTALVRYLSSGWDVSVDEINADVNADGVLDLKDVVLMKRYLVGGWGVVLR